MHEYPLFIWTSTLVLHHNLPELYRTLNCGVVLRVIVHNIYNNVLTLIYVPRCIYVHLLISQFLGSICTLEVYTLDKLRISWIYKILLFIPLLSLLKIVDSFHPPPMIQQQCHVTISFIYLSW